MQASAYSIVAQSIQLKSLEKDGKLYYRYTISIDSVDKLPESALTKAKKVLSTVATAKKTQKSTPIKHPKAARLNHRMDHDAIPLPSYKRECMKVARQLGYDDKVLQMIEAATTEAQVQSALVTGRHLMKD